MSGDGRHLAYSVYSARANVWMVPIPSAGVITADGATQVTCGNQAVETIRVSFDGLWLLYDSNLSGNSDIYRIPMARLADRAHSHGSCSNPVASKALNAKG